MPCYVHCLSFVQREGTNPGRQFRAFDKISYCDAKNVYVLSMELAGYYLCDAYILDGVLDFWKICGPLVDVTCL